MRGARGFTLLELMVVVAILGVLAATAVPLIGVYRQRASGSEAQAMVKQILDAEIMYYLEHNQFFPDNATYTITHPGGQSPGNAQQEIMDNLNVSIPTGHKLDFSITGINVGGGGSSLVTISSYQNSFPIFANGDTFIRGTVDKNGKITIF
jgi:prepilin-type N-terminal cleavage/methylation domain-containing protein